MATRVLLRHRTDYQYDQPVFLSTQWIRLKPAPTNRASIAAYSFGVEPGNHNLHWLLDPFGNSMARVDFSGAVQTLVIQVELVVNVDEVNPFAFLVDSYAESFPFAYEASLAKQLAPYRETTEPGPFLSTWLGQIDVTRRATVDFLVELNQKVSQAIAYVERLEDGVQTAEETLDRARGSCRDSAWLLVQVLRQLGLATRFVSGYLIQLAGSDVSENEPNSDSLSLHAWAEVYLPGAGWIGLDTTSGLLTGAGHVPLACTPEPLDAAPVSGTKEWGNTTLSYSSTLVRLPQ